MSTATDESLEALLALRIMTLLHRQQKSVYALAKEAGLPVKSVQRICKGEGRQPSVWTIAAIARALHVPLDALAGLPDAKTPVAGRQRSRTTAGVGHG